MSDWRGRGDRICFWRTKGGSEIDFVVYGRDGLFGLEVKNAARLRPEDLRGLKAFRDEHPAARVALLYRGRERLLAEGIAVLPCAEFLGRLAPGTGLARAIGGG